MAAHTMLLPDLGRSDAQNVAFRHQRQQTNNPRKLYISLRGLFASAHTGGEPKEFRVRKLHKGEHFDSWPGSEAVRHTATDAR